jgi:hypothetical protein
MKTFFISGVGNIRARKRMSEYPFKFVYFYFMKKKSVISHKEL